MPLAEPPCCSAIRFRTSNMNDDQASRQSEALTHIGRFRYDGHREQILRGGSGTGEKQAEVRRTPTTVRPVGEHC